MNLKAPHFLTGISLLIWGWQQQVLWAAIPMAIVAEIAPLIKTRFDISRKELNILFDMCAVFFAGLLVYGMISESGSKAIFLLVLWLPVVLFPMILVQRYSSEWQLIPMTAISLKARKANRTDKSVDISYLYIVAILLSASSSHITQEFFYISLTLVLFVATIKQRGKFFPIWALFICFPLAAAGGYIIDKGILKTQLYLEDHLGRLFLDWFTGDDDPFSRDTRIGSIGSLKGSGRIIYRLETDRNSTPPKLIRDGSFDILLGNNWSASEISFSETKTDNLMDWRLHAKSQKPKPISKVKISGYFDDNAILASPIGTTSIDSIPAEKIEHTRLGTIKASSIPGIVVYTANYTADGEYNYPPKSHDLNIPKHYKKYLEQLSTEIAINDLPPNKALTKLKSHFLSNFKYSLDLDNSNKQIPPIIDFMVNTRSGHCEYFASATVLMLRHIGIPARYATGYSIQEYDSFEKVWLAREYHAHAWALAHIDGRWINVDNTPPVWLEQDKEEDSILLSLYNALSWARFAYNKWRMGNQEIVPDSYIYTLAVLMTLFIGYRVRQRRKKGNLPEQSSNLDKTLCVNPWNDFFSSIETNTVTRKEHETLFDWLFHCSHHLTDENTQKLREIIRCYYRYRFDPTVDRSKVEKEIDALVDKY